MPTERRVSRSREIPAEPQAIFDLLADPEMHPLIDGSGTVRRTRGANPERLSMGSRFGMNMRFGVPYPIRNTVVEFDEPRLIAWHHVGRHRWRYELEPSADGTLVTETFDWSTSRWPWLLEVTKTPERNARSIEQTLERLAQHFGGGDG